MKTRKAAKILINRAKENPDLYTDQEVQYAKLLIKVLVVDLLASLHTPVMEN